ncbi:MAG: DEAD/DEAH box helicase [Bacteroidota bacterium]|nr:DEAD/DEAH box helicase [Bacteroidota bacterium]
MIKIEVALNSKPSLGVAVNTEENKRAQNVSIYLPYTNPCMSAAPRLNEEQKEVFKTLQKFLEHPAADTFVLKGYAGTGKTFLMQYLGRWLKEKDQNFSFLASTGRAATVLRGKTGFPAKTVHSELYHFSKVDGVDETIPVDAPIDEYGQMTLQFLLRQPDEDKLVYIVDEASMLSSELSEGTSYAIFGSGVLLRDFFDIIGNNKVIFVGDPCQLPPVGQAFSPALDTTWLAQQGRTAVSVTLEKIVRHDAGNDILKLAAAIRNMGLQQILPRYPKLPANRLNNVKLHPSQEVLFKKYVTTYKAAGTNGTLAIARSNRMVNEINRAMRRELYGVMDKPLQVGDVLLVTQNNYAVPLTNGDFVVVCALGEERLQANLLFRSVRIKAVASDIEYELLLSLDILYGRLGNFTKEQMKALMVDFNRRMRRKGVLPNTEKYKTEMKKDDYLNCIRATYGYAVTCHKAQGGEWNDVCLFLEKSMYSMPRPELCKWWYTAVTRAKEELHLVKEWWVV